MRVIAGKFRSRRLKTLPGSAVRPTPDRLRETLFSVLGDEVAGVVFIDAYAGTGAVGIEALSRGARHIILLERNPAAASLIVENLTALGAAGDAAVIRGNALTQLARRPADIVFFDPPYPQKRDYQAALDALAVMSPRLVIAQHDSRMVLPDDVGLLHRTRIIRQGNNSLSFYRPLSSEV